MFLWHQGVPSCSVGLLQQWLQCEDAKPSNLSPCSMETLQHSSGGDFKKANLPTVTSPLSCLMLHNYASSGPLWLDGWCQCLFDSTWHSGFCSSLGWCWGGKLKITTHQCDTIKHPCRFSNQAGLLDTMFSQVFMCQLEGSKHWRLYGPREDGERLPRFSSPNFSQDEVSCFTSKSKDNSDFDRWVSLFWTLCSTLETCFTFPGAPFIRWVWL